jgi:phosphoglycolate phosphatase
MNHPILCADLDGTFINCESRYYSVYRDIILKMDGVPLPQESFWALKREKASDSELLKMSHLDELNNADFRNQVIEKIEQTNYLDMDGLYPGVLPILKEARSYFDKIILITLRRDSNALNSQLKRLGLTEYFDYILNGNNDTVAAWQTKADLFRSLGIKMDPDCVGGFFIGDTEVDILAGKQLGLKTVAVTSGIRSRKVLEQYEPDYIFQDFTDFIRCNCHGK